MAKHTFDLGDRVAIFNSDSRGHFFIEGWGNIKECIEHTDEYYRVEFEDCIRDRFIDPAGQADPEAFIAYLNGMK